MRWIHSLPWGNWAQLGAACWVGKYQVVCSTCSRSRELVLEYHPSKPQRVSLACVFFFNVFFLVVLETLLQFSIWSVFRVKLHFYSRLSQWSHAQVCNGCVAAPAIPENPEEVWKLSKQNDSFMYSLLYNLPSWMQYAKMISLFPEAIWTALDNVKAGKQAKPLSASLGSYSWSRR